MWIRSASWDGFWILSGFPLGLILTLATAFGASPAILSIWFIVLLDMGHNLSPMALAWGHKGFRQIMQRDKKKFIALPLFLLMMGTLAGVVAAAEYPNFQPFTHAALNISNLMEGSAGNPLVWLLASYLLWNLYHFGMQNFGILSIYRQKSSTSYPANQRRIDMTFCLTVQVVVMLTLLAPFIHSALLYVSFHLLCLLLTIVGIAIALREAVIVGQYWNPRIVLVLGHAFSLTLWPGIWIVAINGVNHWLSAIGLSSHVYGRHRNSSPIIFAVSVIILGVALFAALFWRVGFYSWNFRDVIDLAIPYTAFRLSMGFVHFLYDRWLYKLSDPQVQATIGRDLLCVAPEGIS